MRARAWDSLALPLLAAGAMAAATGGTFTMQLSAINSGGAMISGGAFTLMTAIGGMGTAMSGGTLTMTPGVISAAVPARKDLSGAHAYPMPFIPSQGHTTITFSQLPVQATIHVYTLSGRLVKTIDKNDSLDSAVWYPVTNEQGSALASGVYLFTVKQPGFGTKQGKLMIIR